jgi:hypothetical protein
MKGAGRIRNVKDMEFKNGQMVLIIKETGIIIKQMAKDYFVIMTDHIIKEKWKMIVRMVMVNQSILMVTTIKAIGKMIFSTGMENKFGNRADLTLVYTIKAKNMGMVFTFGLMAVNIREIGGRIWYMEMVYITGVMVEFIMENGTKIKCKVGVNILGRMGDSTKVNIKTEKNKDMVFINGLTGVVIKAIGKTEFNMVKVNNI